MPRRVKAKWKTADELKGFDFKKECEQYALSQEQASALLGASQASISRWQLGEVPIPVIYVRYWRLYWSVHKPRNPVERKKKWNKKSTQSEPTTNQD